MLLLLGRRVPLSFVYRLATGCPPSFARPILVNSVLITLRATTRVPHNTVSATTAGQNRGTMPERRPFVRLPADVYPVNYGLCLKPDLIDFTFEGKLEALVEVRVPACLAPYVDLFICAWRQSCYVILEANVNSG